MGGKRRAKFRIFSRRLRQLDGRLKKENREIAGPEWSRVYPHTPTFTANQTCSPYTPSQVFLVSSLGGSSRHCLCCSSLSCARYDSNHTRLAGALAAEKGRGPRGESAESECKSKKKAETHPNARGKAQTLRRLQRGMIARSAEIGARSSAKKHTLARRGDGAIVENEVAQAGGLAALALCGMGIELGLVSCDLEPRDHSRALLAVKALDHAEAARLGLAYDAPDREERGVNHSAGRHGGGGPMVPGTEPTEDENPRADYTPSCPGQQNLASRAGKSSKGPPRPTPRCVVRTPDSLVMQARC